MESEILRAFLTRNESDAQIISISTQACTEAKGLLTLTPTAYGVGTADGCFPDGTQARRMQIGGRSVF